MPQYHKTLRHPSLLKLITVRQSSHKAQVVTEAATPLITCQSHLTGWEIATGLTKVLETLHFLHTQASVSHNNVSPESIFITPDGEWKLGRLDCCRRHCDNSANALTSCCVLFDSQVYTDGKQVSKVIDFLIVTDAGCSLEKLFANRLGYCINCRQNIIVVFCSNQYF